MDHPLELGISTMQWRGAYLLCTIQYQQQINIKAMNTGKKLGIWMDHSNAHLIECTMEPLKTHTLESKFTHQEKEHSLGKSENLMHNKEQHQQSEYYKKLEEIIKGYEEVLLFGPTDAKVELFNLVRANHLFEKIKIVVKQADKMTDNQQHAFVRDYFSESHRNNLIIAE
jgi:hypothetical protein